MLLPARDPSGCLPAEQAAREGEVRGAPRTERGALQQMAVIYEPLRMVGLMNATRHVFGMEGPCSAITLTLRGSFSNVAS